MGELVLKGLNRHTFEEKLMANARRRLNTMIEYCETTSCLRAYILNYFGVASPGRCGACGSCAGETREGASEQLAGTHGKRAARVRTQQSADGPLFERLKELRRQLALSRSVPAYVIFPDSTLREMSVMKPRSMEEFMKVPGVGVAKQRSYGREFLRAIAEFEEGRTEV